MSEKLWNGEPFWGLGYEWDPDWVLSERQKELRDLLIELCEKEMRANALFSMRCSKRAPFCQAPAKGRSKSGGVTDRYTTWATFAIWNAAIWTMKTSRAAT